MCFEKYNIVGISVKYRVKGYFGGISCGLNWGIFREEEIVNYLVIGG